MSEHPAATALDPEFETLLRQCLDGLVTPQTQLREDTDLTAFGVDSLIVVRLLVTIEETFQVTLPDEAISFEIFSSPGALWDVVAGLLEPRDDR
ncbi:phosphopantetheine-binding protein [Lentzea sp. E54]|uniref:phosphopantetheine-binding protein n=1 Tax=Lentzea xerophila TaxID=3435883 RepID=UPI003DA5EEDF